MPMTDERRADQETAGRRRPGLARAIVFCLALLLALEGLARWGLPLVATSELFYDQRALLVLAERDRTPAPAVWLIGDSTVVGLDVAPREAPGPVLERALRKTQPAVEVRPIGHGGVGLDNVAEIVRKLPLRPGDVVLVSTHLAHATAYHDVGWGERDAKTWQDRVERAARRQADRVALVRHRKYLSRMPILLGRNGVLPRRIGFRLRRTRPGPLRRELWTTGRLPEADLKSLITGYGSLDDRNAVVIHEKLARIDAILKAREIAFVTFVTPLNREIVERYEYADWSTLVRVAGEVCKLSARAGVGCLNLVNTIPAEYFYDDDHLMAEGYPLLASKLVPPLMQLL